MRCYVGLVALAGCFRSPFVGAPDDAPGDVHHIDAVVHDDGCTSFSTQFDTCGMSFTMPMTIGSDKIYNTMSHVLADYPGGTNGMTLAADQQTDITTASGPINVFIVTTFNITGGHTLHVVGPKPFGIVGNGDITIDGTLDGSADTLVAAAGAWNANDCAASTPATPGNHVGGAAGGGGGGFQGHGGHGQDSDSNEGGETGASGGTAIAAMPLGLRGGCPGGTGGSVSNMNGRGGQGGGGGGAVDVVSGTAVAVHGAAAINVGGGAGLGGNAIDGGAGGGGSGGMIFLEAPQVSVQGVLAANGGSGGSGAGGNASGAIGQPGQASASAAVGAPGNGAGGPGANGSAGAQLDGADNVATRPPAAGGGGGGSAGYIAIKSASQQLGTTSPSPSPWPF
jgi:hypothetical protein